MSGVHWDRVKKRKSPRLWIQIAAAALFNGYAAGFAKGGVFQGAGKYVCVPVLNCYSCPGALGSCPVGALQTVIGGSRHQVSFYVLGSIMLFGILLGRLICGFLCPFGLVQDLLHRIPVRKWRVPARLDMPLRWLKYLVLAVLVILLPMLAANEFGTAPPFFCKYLCPAGTLEGGIPQLLLNERLRPLAGLLFDWKMLVLAVILISSIKIGRPFCRYLCPLGALYGLFNRFSLVRMHLDHGKCVGCHACERCCPMQVETTKNINSPECIRCGRCKAVCPTGAITTVVAMRDTPEEVPATADMK